MIGARPPADRRTPAVAGVGRPGSRPGSRATFRAAPPCAALCAVLCAVAWTGVATAAATTASSARSGGADGLRRALAPHAWMSRQPGWPCRYGARVEQRRTLGERVLVSDGRVFQDCGRGLVWQVERPLPGVQVYAHGANYLELDRRAVPRTLDGLAERRIGATLQDLFGGDIEALQREFDHELIDGGEGEESGRNRAVRLIPRDPQLAARLAGIVIRGDGVRTTIRVDTAGMARTDAPAGAPADRLEWRLDGFEALPADSGGAASRRCTDWLGEGADGDGVRVELARAGCDALARPGRWLDKARGGQR